MKINHSFLACTSILTASFLAPLAIAQDADKPRFKITDSKIIVQAPADPFAENNRDGRIIFAGQPTEDELRAFAAAGGSVVLSTRSVKEMEGLDFDQIALCEELGLAYINIPVSGSKLTAAEPFALTLALSENPGTILMHCGSGSRAAMLYGLQKISTNQMDKQQALAHALDMGMGASSVPYFQKALMDTPQRATSAIDPARLISDVQTLANFGTRHTLSDTISNTRGIGAARRWVHTSFTDAIANHGKEDQYAPFVTFDSHTVEPDGRRITEQVEVVNVLCTIPGTNPESTSRLYYVLAHLDSRATGAMDSTSDAPGANDDASGVAALIELARVLSKESLDSTIVLMATSGEEQGLFGARLHAQDLVNQNADVRAVLNNDTIGDPTGVGDLDGSKEVRIFSEALNLQTLNLDNPAELKSTLKRLRSYGAESDSPSRQIARYIQFVSKLHGELPVKPKLIFRPDRYLRGGDHTPFNELGFAAVRFCEVYENYDHQHQDVRIEDGTQFGDLAEYVDAEYLAGVTKLNAAVLVHITNAPSSPSNTRIITAELTNDTTLRWDASPESDTAGYEVMWRETTDHDWKKFKDVGNVTEATIELSKDNWIFGVRAYDQAGYRSPASYPTSARE
ncbi:MAG: M20/M25/M40 family metallo-hydrolase [Phycisphaerales bacterium]